MGSDPTTFATNYFLYYYDRKWFLEIKKWDLLKARLFPNIFRFIINLCTFNNDEFENYYNEIYPGEMELNKENEDPCKASFLNISIEVLYRKFTTELFDKRDAFHFYINCIPYLNSNIPSEIFYASIFSDNSNNGRRY